MVHVPPVHETAWFWHWLEPEHVMLHVPASQLTAFEHELEPRQLMLHALPEQAMSPFWALLLAPTVIWQAVARVQSMPV